MTKTPHVVITGATGFVARNVRKLLSENDIILHSISRRNFKGFRNEEKIITNNYDPVEILPKIGRPDVLLHLVGIGSQSAKTDFNSVNFLLTKRIVKLCKLAGIKKIVYLSGLGVSKYNTLEYFLSKYRAEDEITKSGLDYTIFRPSYIVGRDDLLTRYLKRQIQQGQIFIPGSGQFQIQPISIANVSQVIFESLTAKKFSNKTLDLVGPELITYEAYVKKFSKYTRTKIIKIPLEKAYYDAISGRGGNFGIDDLNLLIGSFCGNFKRLQATCIVNIQPIG